MDGELSLKRHWWNWWEALGDQCELIYLWHSLFKFNIAKFVMNYAYMGRLNNFWWMGIQNIYYVFMEVTLLFEVWLMMFLGVWDVYIMFSWKSLCCLRFGWWCSWEFGMFLLVSMFPICVCKRINVGCCDFVLGRMGCCKNDFDFVWDATSKDHDSPTRGDPKRFDSYDVNIF